MQLSIRSSRLAPLAKCPRDIIIRNWVIWAKLGWAGRGLLTDLASSLALGPALEPWEGFLGVGGKRDIQVRRVRAAGVSLAALGSGDRGKRSQGNESPKPGW